MKYIDRGIVYIPIDKDTTKDEMDKLKASYVEQGKTVVFLRSGDKDIKTVIGELIRTRLNP
jgi:precorrin-4 methylase